MELSNTSLLSSLLITVILIVSIIPKLVSSQFSSFNYKWCSNHITYTPNSTYQSNLKAVLNSLSTTTQTTNGFYNFTRGHRPDRVSSFALCRGDVPVNRCRPCVRSAAKLILKGCPNKKQGFGYSDYCSIYFSNGTIYGKVQKDVLPWNSTRSNIFWSSNGFNESLYSLINSLQKQAASGNSSLKYAVRKAVFSAGQNLYGLVQCTPDLSEKSCLHCIQGLVSIFPKCCVSPTSTIPDATIVQPSCFLQYKLNPFYGIVLDLPPPPPPLLSNQRHNISSIGGKGKPKNGRTIAAITIPIGVSTILVTSIVYCILLKRRRRRGRLRSQSISYTVKFSKEEIEALDTLQFNLRTVKNATQNFSDDHKLGAGGFGTVYKGILSDGQEVAVKRCLRKAGQGDVEFKNEILILANLRHKNLVQLLGFCLHGKEMILIYEFLPNRSLDYFVFGRLSRPPMKWETRYKIINGIVKGILYLHEESRIKIIHRDLKAGNVLLDEYFNPRIADFGMARLFNIDQTQTLASKIVGTLGYISPEYALQRQVSVKVDIYSFGVLVLEIVSGKAITSFCYDEYQENLLNFAWRNWTEGTPWNLVDPAIAENGSSIEILRCIHIGLLCVQDNPADRPTMSIVDMMLSSNSVTLQPPLRPAFFTQRNYVPVNKSAEVSINGVSITELHPR